MPYYQNNQRAGKRLLNGRIEPTSCQLNRSDVQANGEKSPYSQHCNSMLLLNTSSEQEIAF